ncbi:unnamed protein product [Medioppia subpectinata]|uniref:Uncharacterized protein n=1 Tax=Medioppia subpectinata TaxID=1979941 RepID=A0A7R9KC79_9ACAR|nr:unnamed protein product [Medioppia subpectinata]CAG2099977.1 unnamed protein product [Medioppia subpectinata]
MTKFDFLNFLSPEMSATLEKIKEIETEMARTQKNKATSNHLGLLKAKLAKLRKELIAPVKGSTNTEGGFDVSKTGVARIGFVGFPSVGKSTLMSKLTGVDSEVAAYEFTTLTAIPGVVQYNGAKLQIIDLPGIIEGAKDGKGRGRQTSGIRLNKQPPSIKITKRDKGGINCTGGSFDIEISNAEVNIQGNPTIDEFIDSVAGNRKYIPAIYVLNKIDAISIEELDIIYRIPHAVPISADKCWNFDTLMRKSWEYLNFTRIYPKPKGKEVDYEEPVILREKKRTVADFCNSIHRQILSKFKYAIVWGTSVKHQKQKVGKDHVLNDCDVVQIVKDYFIKGQFIGNRELLLKHIDM